VSGFILIKVDSHERGQKKRTPALFIGISQFKNHLSGNIHGQVIILDFYGENPLSGCRVFPHIGLELFRDSRDLAPKLFSQGIDFVGHFCHTLGRIGIQQFGRFFHFPLTAELHGLFNNAREFRLK